MDLKLCKILELLIIPSHQSYSTEKGFLRTNPTITLPGLLSSGDCLLTGDENGDLSLRDLYTMEVLNSVPLQLPITSLALTRGNSHVLAPLRDGKMIVIGLSGIPEHPPSR